MSDTRYPTRMHEVLGVETGELFSIYEFADDELAYVDTNGNVLNAKNNIPVGPYTLTVAINRGIIRKPRLDGCQKHLLKLLAKLDLKWLTIDSQNLIIAWEDKPKRITTAWFEKEGDYDTVNRYAISASKCPTLAALVSWSDPEPLDIVKTLRDAGVTLTDPNQP